GSYEGQIRRTGRRDPDVQREHWTIPFGSLLISVVRVGVGPRIYERLPRRQRYLCVVAGAFQLRDELLHILLQTREAIPKRCNSCLLLLLRLLEVLLKGRLAAREMCQRRIQSFLDRIVHAQFLLAFRLAHRAAATQREPMRLLSYASPYQFRCRRYP